MAVAYVGRRELVSLPALRAFDAMPDLGSLFVTLSHSPKRADVLSHVQSPSNTIKYKYMLVTLMHTSHNLEAGVL